MLRPVYLHGPPVAWQIWSTNSLISRSLLVLANFRLMRSSFSWRSTTARTTAVMASVPPSRSYRERSTVPPPVVLSFPAILGWPAVPQHRNTDNTPLAATDSDAPLAWRDHAVNLTAEGVRVQVHADAQPRESPAIPPRPKWPR